MENEIYNSDIAFSCMQDAIKIVNEDEIHIAEKMRELEELKIKKENDYKRVFQYAANYFTREKIVEIHRLCEEVLKSSEFNEDDYIEKFADTAKIRMDDIAYLLELQNNIIEVKEKLNFNKILSLEEKVQEKGFSKIMIIIADILLRKDGANDD